MKKVNIRQAILDAIDRTDASIARYEGQMMKWSRYVEKEIGSLNGYPRAGKKYTVNGSIIELPDNCLNVLAVVPGDFEEDINVYYRSLIETQIEVTQQYDYSDGYDLEYIWKSLDVLAVNHYFWEQVGNTLNLISTFKEQDITVIYTHLETNDEGYYIVNDSHVEAITSYLIYMLAKKDLWRSFKSAPMMRTGALNYVDTLKREYSVSIRDARARDGKETPFETEQY